MAHPRIIAQRQAIAVERLMTAARKLAKQHNLKEQGNALDAATARDPAMAQMLQAEALADLLEGVVGGKPASKKPDGLQEVEAQLEAETSHDVVQSGTEPPTFVETDKPAKPIGKGRAT